MMGRTIIQPIGPLYGEAVNGTVFGRPNGSIYIPETNEINLILSATGTYIKETSAYGIDYLVICTSTGTAGVGNDAVKAQIVAKSQDNQSYMQVQVSEDSEFTTYESTDLTAGNFNMKPYLLSPDNTIDIVGGTTYYIRAQLIAASGVAVATSEVKELTGWTE